MAKKKADSFFDDVILPDDVLQDEAFEEEIPDEEYVPEVFEPPQPKRQGRPMIVRETKVDSMTVLRKRVPLTKSMCHRQGCKYDAAREMGFTAYKNIPPEQRAKAKTLLQAHVSQSHNGSEDYIVFESDMPKDWMSSVPGPDGKSRRVQRPRDID